MNLNYLILMELAELPDGKAIKATTLLKNLDKIITIAKLNAQLKTLRIKGFVKRFLKDGREDSR